MKVATVSSSKLAEFKTNLTTIEAAVHSAQETINSQERSIKGISSELRSVENRLRLSERTQDNQTKAFADRFNSVEKQLLDNSMERSRIRAEEVPSGVSQEIEMDLASVKCSVQALHKQLNSEAEKIMLATFK